MLDDPSTSGGMIPFFLEIIIQDTERGRCLRNIPLTSLDYLIQESNSVLQQIRIVGDSGEGGGITSSIYVTGENVSGSTGSRYGTERIISICQGGTNERL